VLKEPPAQTAFSARVGRGPCTDQNTFDFQALFGSFLQVEICLRIVDKVKAVVELVSIVPLPERRMFERQPLVWGASTNRGTFERPLYK
jgi:hypothetical protein